MDKIIAKGLTFSGCHGVLPTEKTTPQTFIIDLELWLDLKLAARNDDINFTVNYDQLFHQVERIVKEESFNLIETLAETIAQKIINDYPVEAVEITVYKPQAPVSGNFDHFAVKMIRFR
jgi:dihydroneopterin aldolase